MDLSYILNEFAEERENYFNAVSPPIMQTSNFAFKKVEDLRKVFEDEYSNYLYSRGLNPTIDILRKDFLPGSENALTATTEGYEAGRFSYLDLLDAQRTVFVAELAMSQAQLGELTAAVQLYKALAGSWVDEPTARR